MIYFNELYDVAILANLVNGFDAELFIYFGFSLIQDATGVNY